MLGIDDPAIYLGYLFSIFSLILCIVYGAVTWNKGDVSDKEEEIQEDIKWDKQEELLNDEF